MPLTPVDYSKTVIYKIQHNEDETLLYVGSTTDFTRRKSKHKSDCNNINGKSYNYKVYQMIRDNGGWEAFNMIEIEKYPCNDKREAEKRENEIMMEMKCNMNMRKSHCGFDTRNEYQQQYYNDNKGTMHEYRGEKITCECGCLIRRSDISKHRKSNKHIQLMTTK